MKTTIFFFLAMNLCMIPLTYSQQIKGTIVGNNETLPGVTVRIQGLNVGAATDLDGNFILNIPASGNYTLNVTCIGYQPKNIDIELTNENVDLKFIHLESRSSELEEIVVTGAMGPSQMKAYNIKKNSPAMVDVIASDAIGKLPDRNAAEAIQRIKGVAIERDLGEGRYASVRGTPMQWSSSLLNGNRLPSASGDYNDRRVQMDIFPSELIEFVQLSKAVTPDMEGDAIGGSINFITKTAPLRRLLNINMAGGYADQSRAGSYNGSLVYGDRLLDGKLGFILSAMIWNRGAANDRYNLSYNYTDQDPVKSYSIAELQLRDYVVERTTTGFNGGIEYEFNKNHKIFAKGVYSEYLDKQRVHETYFNLNNKNAQIQTRGADYNIKLHSIELGGESTLSNKVKLDWSMSADQSSFRFRDGYPMATFQQQATYEGLSSDGNKYLRMDAPDGVGDQIDKILPHLSVNTPIDPDKMMLRQVILINNDNSERNKRVVANLRYDVTNELKLKFGGKYIDKRKDVASPMDVYMPKFSLGISSQLPPTIADLGTESFPYNGGFLSEIGHPYNNEIIDQMRMGDVRGLLSEANISNYDLLKVASDTETNTGASKFFHGTERVYAAYLMGEYRITSKMALIGGIRNEYNEVMFYGHDVSDAQNIVAVTQDNSYNAFLPMVHLKYDMSENSILRASYTRTFARADFGSLNPGITKDDTQRTINYGNAKLKPTFSNNFDLAFEHYFGVLGLIDGGVFYKKMSDLIYTNQGATEIGGVQYTTLRPQNIEDAWLMGFEVGFSKRFNTLPSFWRGFGVEGNYTFTDSETKVPRWVNGTKIEDKTVIPKQSKHLFNAVLLYEYNRLSARLSGNYKGKYLDAIRQGSGTEHYRWYASNFTVDFSGSYAISPTIRFFLELNNLTNAPVRFYHGTYDRAEQAEWYSFRGQAGISVKLY
jgi:TonB-dependent receptor